MLIYFIFIFQLRKDGQLNVRDIQHIDQGNYTCNAENVHGSDSITYQVVVRGKQ